MIFRVLRFFFVYLWELTHANVKVAIDALSPKFKLDPAMAEIALDGGTDYQILLFANLITMTPGTLSVDVAPDRKSLLVHFMYKEDIPHMRKEFKDSFNKMFRGPGI